MRKFQIPALLALVVTMLTIYSCSKEVSEENSNPGAKTVNFYATIDGADWKADSLEQVLVTDSLVTISGLSTTSQELSIVLPAFAVGSYNLNVSTMGYGLYTTLSAQPTDVFLTNGSSDASKASGTVKITAIDTINKTVTGTFAFTAYRNGDQKTVSVTSGVFNAMSYTVTSGGGPGGGTDTSIVDNGVDTLSAFVDGNFFVAAKGMVTGAIGSPFLSLLGTNDQSQSISLVLPDTISTGVRALNYNTQTYIGLYIPTSTEYFAPLTDGQLTVLTHDVANKRITGTFSFTGTNITMPDSSHIITKGYFGITYQ